MNKFPINFPLQIDFTFILLLLPLILCCVLSTLRRGPARSALEADTWFLSDPIVHTYDAIKKETEEWLREEAPSKPEAISLSRGRGRTAFKVSQEIPPKLYRLHSDRYGEVIFELTEVEGDGTAVKTIYNPGIRGRLQTLRAKLPVKTYFMYKRSNCSSPVLQGYLYCPYCGQKQER
ncbi:MAG: hypothetical protein ACUVTD_04010 [Nitrososphaerales archaeon]